MGAGGAGAGGAGGALQALLEAGVTEGVYPAAQACVLHRGHVLFSGHAGACDAGTLFDLASVTKVLSTTAAFMALWGAGVVEPGTPLGRLLPGAAAHADTTLEDLLRHRAGLPAWRPFFALPEALPAVQAAGDGGAAGGSPPGAWARSRRAVAAAALACAPEAPLRARSVYSDVGFILLGEALAAAEGGAPLDAVFFARVAGPLGLAARFHRLSAPESRKAPCAPTGRTRPREPAPGQEGLWQLAERPSPPGEVDDDNAWAMDGVAGHAGLFSTAEDLARYGQAVLAELEGAGRLAPAASWRRALQRDALVAGSTRAMGFDTPSAEGSSSGRHFSPAAAGHLGFTGTSLWVDPPRALVVALVTNRTATGRANQAIRTFRPRFHDAVAPLLR
jgi:CubicO group peptidase (beta-lactamase class C family)